jgi:hypothetical protein
VIEKSQITLLSEAVGKASVMRGIPVLLGAEMLAVQGGAGRVVLIPTGGQFKRPFDSRARRDLDQTLIAHVWGRSIDDTLLIVRRLLQAVDEAPGLAWDARSMDWDDTPDSSKQGQVAIVTLIATIALLPVEVETTTVEIEEVDLRILNE